MKELKRDSSTSVVIDNEPLKSEEFIAVVSISGALGLISIEGVFSSRDLCDEFMNVAVPANPGLQFFSRIVTINKSRYTTGPDSRS